MKRIIKVILKNSVFRILSVLNKVIPKKDNYVLLYITSYGLRHNLTPLFNFMINNEYNKKYHIICSIEDKKYKGADYTNVEYVNNIVGIFRFLITRHVFYTVGQIPIKPSKNQIVIHMSHGTTDYKTMGALSKSDFGDLFYFTYTNVPSEYYREIASKEYLCPMENVVVCNEPMTDAFYQPIVEKYNFEKYKKVIVWLPTFRQSAGLNQTDSTLDKPLIIFDESDYLTLNEKLQRYNYKLIVKLHTAQVLNEYRKIELSNLTVVSSEEFMNDGHDLYQLLMHSDALIGDYSSVSLQYLLLDRPLVYVIPDIEDYKQRRGFVFDNPEEYMPGYIIRTKEDFYEFLEDFSIEIDRYREERQRVKKIIHHYDDGNACNRVLRLSQMSL